ncbi:MAG: hypothetical protein QF921_08270 [Pseudomonadales bacterium]|jgi:hypothetical protein|nr:hypothetical protein [Pseudomonadales bacterium]MDP6472579.1 hypothetical protein [Pseudomonadales bacterium]MDP6829293.1 hypothetical protein [Pseudomonadales bacterium]MDP6971493.1 hypothetical protein [Pseudomonadales bacterium]|tara:strand:- start:644 stop:1039 length:396 start_codon:yes stop_codon:yes gene_type:complete
MSIGTWDPKRPSGLDDEVLAELRVAAQRLDEPDFGLNADQIGRLAAFARVEGNEWGAAIGVLDDDLLVGLVRLLVLAEGRFPSWEGGAKSPVILMARELRQRDAYPDDLTAWIRVNSDNRFLPHGSLLDRL